MTDYTTYEVRVYSDGTKEWWLNGKRLTEKEHAERVNPSCSGKMVEIDGVKYKLVPA